MRPPALPLLMPLTQLAGALSLEDLHRVLDFLPDGVAILSPSGTILLINRALVAMLGYDRDGADPHISAYAHPAESAAIGHNLTAMAEGERIFSSRTFRHASGRWIEAEVVSTPLPGGLVCSVIRDVTERRRAAHETARTLERLRQAVEASLDTWMVLEAVRDEAGKIVDFSYVDLNGRAAAATGNSVGELRGARMRERLPNADVLIAKYAAVVDLGVPLAEEYQTEHEGSVQRWVSHEVVPVGDGVAVTARDVSDKKRRDEQLRESEARFRSATQFSAIGLALVGLDGQWLSINPALTELLGYSEQELMGRTFQEITHPDDLNLDLAYVGQMLRGELKTYQMDKRYFHKNGSVVWARLTVSLVHDRHGAPSYFISQIQNITAQRDLAERLRHAEKMEAVGRLAGGIAHDFNNVLTSVRGNAELLHSTLGTSELGESARAIVDDAERAARITRQLLLFSRQHVSNPHPIDLAAAVRDTVPLLERLLGPRVSLAIDLNASSVRADPDQLQQVLLNLCLNARDAMPNGGTVRLATRHRHVEGEVQHRHGRIAPGHYAVLTVADSGTGMTDEVIARLFEPFFTTKGDAGNGIGLATVYGIVEHHGGAIVVCSVVGGGSTFELYLPTVPQESAGAVDGAARPAGLAAVGAAASNTAPRTKLLVVDDEPSVRETARRILEWSGYDVVAVASGEVARDFLDSLPRGGLPSAVITDVTMQGMNGRELGDLIAQRWPDLPVAYMSGFSGDGLLQAGVLDASRRFIAKPFSLDELLETVRVLVETPRDDT